MKSRDLFGLLLIILGAGFLCDKLGVFNFNEIIGTWWPIAIIIIGLYQFTKGYYSRMNGIIVTLIGVILQLWELGFISGSLAGLFWPVVIIIIGISILYPRRKKGSDGVITTEDQVDYFSAFSGLETRNTSQNFTGGSITAIFGGSNIDLTNAKLSEYGAKLSCFAAFGGIEVTVPKNWKVVTTGIPIFGGWSNKTHCVPDGSNTEKTIEINCIAAFGGIEVKNRLITVNIGADK